MREGGAKERLPTGFPCLKALKLTNMDFHSADMLSCVFETIRHLPSLETLEIIACYHQVYLIFAHVTITACLIFSYICNSAFKL